MANRRGRPRSTATQKVKILDKTFQIIELFSTELPCWTLAGVTKETGLPKTTAYRILNVLQDKKILSHDRDSEQYRLGPLALQIGRRAMAQIDVCRISRPVLNDLALRTKETALLAMLSPLRDSVICTLQINNNPGSRLMLEDGMRVPMHAGASAKVILAYMPDNEIDVALSKMLEKLTDKTVTDRTLIENELDRIRNCGYGMSIEEINEGGAAIAMPIFDSSHEVIGSVGIIGPSDRFRKLDTEVMAKYLKDSTAGITRELGG